jgi:UDPglucose 6-dehydrogenase
LANYGNDIICVDSDRSKIDMLNSNILTIYEPGIRDIYESNVKAKRLSFTDDIRFGIENSDVIFLAVGTPEGKDHRPDMSYIKKAAQDIGKYMNAYKLVVNKSTVPIGTADLVKSIIKGNQSTKQEFDVVSNPEFLREGTAVRDFSVPDRIVIGVDSKKAESLMMSIYGPIARTGKPIMVTSTKSAELIKYASNAMLATRISFMNQLVPLCEKIGADIKEVSKGVGLDSRIGPRFLQAGIGYGGSCFPKDVKALYWMLKDNGCDGALLEAVDNINEKQKVSLYPKIKKLLGSLDGKTITVWGLSYKPKTDDIREAPSIALIKKLLDENARIIAYDPAAMDNSKKILNDNRLSFANTPYDAVKGSECLAIVTEWDEFRELDFKMIKSLMKSPNIVDGRNIYNPNDMKEMGFDYISLGR